MRTFGALIAVALVAAACAAPPGGQGPGGSARAFCDVWDTAIDAPPTEDEPILVKDEVVAFAEATEVVGDRCTDPAARVELDRAALAEGEEIPSDPQDPASAPMAVATGDEIAAEEPVLDNVTFRSLSAWITFDGLHVTGNVDVRLSGVTSTIGFSGTVRDLQNWSLRLSSSAFSVPGITTTPATFSGSVVVTNGEPTLSLTAAVGSARIGDVSINGARVALTASPATGVDASVSGQVEVGGSSFEGSVDVVFDATGSLVSANADVSARLRGLSGPGQYIDLTGRIVVEGDASSSTIDFTGSGVIGDLQVNAANGRITVAGNRTTFTGVIDVNLGPTVVRYRGSIVWENGIAHMPYFFVEAGGQYSGVLDDGQLVEVSGLVTVEQVQGGILRTTVTGDIRVGSLRATGVAIVDADGPSVGLTVFAEIQNPQIEGQLTGVVHIYDGSAQLVDLDAQISTLTLGDVELSDVELSVRSEAGAPMDLSVGGALAVGDEVTGDAWLELSLDPDGGLQSLDGAVSVQLALDGFELDAAATLAPGSAIDEAGKLQGTHDAVTITLERAEVSAGPFNTNVTGTFTSYLGTPRWEFNGEANDVSIGPVSLKDGELRIWSNDPRVIGARAEFTWGGIGYEADATLRLRPDSSIERLHLTGRSLRNLQTGLPLIYTVLMEYLNNATPFPVTGSGPPSHLRPRFD